MDPIRYFSALLMVGALLAVAIWALRRFRPGASGQSRSTISVISHASLGAREKLVVVRFAGRDHLLGVTPRSVSLLASADADADALRDAGGRP
jgi:flagellar biosynthetic protein FliO